MALPLRGLRSADPASAGQLGRLIAAALDDDPLHRWLIPNDDDRATVMPAYYAGVVRRAFMTGEVHTTDDYTAVAVWLHHDAPAASDDAAEHGADGSRVAMRCAGPAAALVTDDPYVVRVGAKYRARLRRAEIALHRARVTGPTVHRLGYLAVHPSRRGQGIGTALLRWHLDNTDVLGITTYAEATTQGRRLLYTRHGFRDVRPIALLLAHDAPTVWPMSRAPAAHPPVPHQPRRPS